MLRRFGRYSPPLRQGGLHYDLPWPFARVEPRAAASVRTRPWVCPPTRGRPDSDQGPRRDWRGSACRSAHVRHRSAKPSTSPRQEHPQPATHGAIRCGSPRPLVVRRDRSGSGLEAACGGRTDLPGGGLRRRLRATFGFGRVSADRARATAPRRRCRDWGVSIECRQSAMRHLPSK